MTKTGFFKKVRSAKKGGESVEAGFVSIGLLLAGLAMVIIFVIISVGVYSWFKKQNEQGPQESFYQLMTKVKALDGGRFPDGIEQAYYIKDGYYLFGFNLDPDAIKDSKGVVNKPQKPGSTEGGSDFCGSEEACICLCSNHNCDGSVTCNTELVTGKTLTFNNIHYFVVTGNPKNNHGKNAENLPAGSVSGKYLAIFGSDWKGGRTIKLKRTGEVVEITFP